MHYATSHRTSEGRAIHSSNHSQGKLKKGVVFQNYPFNSVNEYNPNLLVRPFTSQTQPNKKPSTAQSMRNLPRATTSQSQRQPKFIPINSDQADSETRPSKRYMKIYYIRTNYKTILHNTFNSKLQALPPGDQRRPAVLAITQDKFKDLNLQEVNLLICQHEVSEKFYVYFSDAEWIPLSRCCQSTIFLLLSPSSHKTDIFCCQCSRNLQNPPKSAITSNTILPKTSFPQYGHSIQEQRERQKVSRMIVSGKFRKVSLKNIYNEQIESKEEQSMAFESQIINKDKQQESTILELKDLINELF